MVAERKKKPPKPRVEQTGEGVRITRPGRVLRKVGPERAVLRKRPPPIRCPYCTAEGRTGFARRITGSGGVSYYECLECCEPEFGAPQTFKVLTSKTTES